MTKCTFCKYVIEQGTGTMFVKNDGSIFYYCGSKCENNMRKLKRKPRFIKWTKAFEKGGGKK